MLLTVNDWILTAYSADFKRNSQMSAGRSDFTEHVVKISTYFVGIFCLSGANLTVKLPELIPNSR